MQSLKLRLQAFWRHPLSKFKRDAFNRNDYALWLKHYAGLDDTHRELIRSQISGWESPPLLSVIMPVYNADIRYLRQAIDSVRRQLYPHWQLCIADDCSTHADIRPVLEEYAAADSRIQVVYRPENGHISLASNSAIELATGEWIALLDQDDLLTEDALFYVARAIIAQPDVQLIYSDEDKIRDNGQRYDPGFKPDWNPDFLRGLNIISHLGVYRTSRVRALGGFRKGYEGAQDHDLALRYTEGLPAGSICHIPRVLYHWRSHKGSTAQKGSNKNYASSAGQRAIQDHLARTHVQGDVEVISDGVYRIRYHLPQNPPLVSLIIPTRNGLALTRQCISSILEKTTYPNYEILLVDNNSDDPATLRYFESLQGHPRIRVLRDEQPFNYSAINNDAVQHARGEIIGLVNNDIEVIAPDWLSEMVSLAIQPGVGAVGARLLYPDGRLQHGGVLLGLGGVAGHAHKFLKRKSNGYMKRARLTHALTAVTAACLIVRKSIYESVGGLDAEHLKIAFNDVDFCLRVHAAGYRNIWTPHAELYHHESATRGREDTPEKQQRFLAEIAFMEERWGDMLAKDPAYNPNLTRDREDFSLAWPPRNDSDPTLVT